MLKLWILLPTKSKKYKHTNYVINKQWKNLLCVTDIFGFHLEPKLLTQPGWKH